MRSRLVPKVLGVVLLTTGLLVPLAPVARASVALTVISTGDGALGLLNDCTGALFHTCTLRAAIQKANVNGGGSIGFSISGTGVRVINVGGTTGLPAITQSLTIDGTTQPGYSKTQTPLIELNGSGAGSGAVGLTIEASNTTIKGLDIGNFGGGGILATPTGSSSLTGITITKDFVGTDPSGMSALPNGGIGIHVHNTSNSTVGPGDLINNNIGGVKVDGDAPDASVDDGVIADIIGLYIDQRTTVPGTDDGDDFVNVSNGLIANNVIGNNGGDGIEIRSDGLAPATGNVVRDNHIGTNGAGTAARPNTGNGIRLVGASANTIGPGNLISGNQMNGIEIQSTGPLPAVGNTVSGNTFGLTGAGSPLANTLDGILVLGDGSAIAGAPNVIGGAGAGNTIGYDLQNGIHIEKVEPTNGLLVQGNLIGASAAGALADGVLIDGSSNITVGGTSASARNVISNNQGNGVELRPLGAAPPTGNIVEGNFVGTNAAGTGSLANGADGILLSGNGLAWSGAANAIGGSVAGAGNVVSGNGMNGIDVANAEPTNGLLVQGNLIGTNAAGNGAIGNGDNGVALFDSSNVTVGGLTAGAGNLISGNVHNGSLPNPGTNNVFEGNYIGTDITGTFAVANGGDGILFAGTGVPTGGAPDVVGGTAPGAGNLISGNIGSGIAVENFMPANGLLIQGNEIGREAVGAAALGNGADGVTLTNSTNMVIGGTAAGAGNVIAASGLDGIHIDSSGPADGDTIQGNAIGTDFSGTSGLGNSFSGLHIVNSYGNTIGGVGAGAANVVAMNAADGVRIDAGLGNGVRGNAVYSNSGLQLDLGGSGVPLPNDVGDGDGGANNLQNFPIVTGATSTGAATSVKGTLSTVPSTAFTIDLYANTSCDPSGYGGGQTYLGSTAATTDLTGKASFSASLSPVVVGQVVTATATDAAGNTSEFSPCTTVAASGTISDSVQDFFYKPKSPKVGQGKTLQWNFAGPSVHTSTDSTAMGLFDSGNRSAGASYSFTFVAAGSYPFHSTFGTDAFSGSVKVPLKGASTGTVGVPFPVTWASSAPPGYTFDVQVMVPGDLSWHSWRSGVATTTDSYTPLAAGTYQFRARIHFGGSQSNYSAARPVAVT